MNNMSYMTAALLAMSLPAFGETSVFVSEAQFITSTGALPLAAPAPDSLKDPTCFSNIVGCDDEILFQTALGVVRVTAPNAYNTSSYPNTTLKHPVTLKNDADPFNWTISGNGPDDYKIDLPIPVYAIGFMLKTNNYAKETITFFDSNGNEVYQTVAGQLETAPYSKEFVGFTFDLPIASVFIDTRGGESSNELLSGIYLNEQGQVGSSEENQNCVDQAETAFQEGVTEGYTNGYEVGQQDGYNGGYADGYDQGYSIGQDVGYSAGYTSGYDVGYGQGHADGHSEGYTEGHQVGFDEGHSAGVSLCQTDPAACGIAAVPGNGNGVINPGHGGEPPGQVKK